VCVCGVRTLLKYAIALVRPSRTGTCAVRYSTEEEGSQGREGRDTGMGMVLTAFCKEELIISSVQEFVQYDHMHLTVTVDSNCATSVTDFHLLSGVNHIM
jgi:hypothetical protein